MDTIFTLLARKGTFDTGQVDRMIEYGKSLVGTGRGSIDNINIKKYYCSSVGPFWSYCENMPDKQEITDQGVICIGLVSLCLRHVASGMATKNILDCKVLQSGGIPLSTGLVNCDETVRMQHEYYSRGTAWEWDKRSKFNLKFTQEGSTRNRGN